MEAYHRRLITPCSQKHRIGMATRVVYWIAQHRCGVPHILLDNKDLKPLAPGEAVPVKLEFKDAPEGVTDVELKVEGP